MPASRTAAEPLGPRPSPQQPVAGFLHRAEVRDVLAWVRLLVDPHDAAAVVRALARPPIELRHVHLARVIQLARRRRLDLVTGLALAIESPRIAPEARERIQRFMKLHKSASGSLDTLAPDAFVGSLIDLLAARGRMLLTPDAAAEQRASLQRLRALASDFMHAEPRSTPRELAQHLGAVARNSRASADSAQRAPAACAPSDALADSIAQAPADTPRHLAGELHADAPEVPPADAGDPLAGQLAATLELMREEMLASVARIGGRLGELRLDTDLDISHGVVRYLELLKLAALMQRPVGQSMADALSDINARLLAATTPVQREVFQTSTLDEALLAAGSTTGELDFAGIGEGGQVYVDRREHQPEGAHSQAIGAAVIGDQEEHSLGPFLPRKGVGLALSASDIETYRSCPLRYKYARVLRIPTEQTLYQRFGITVHQVLERFHADGRESLAQMLELFDAGWRRGGFGEEEAERELYRKGSRALTHYHARLHEKSAEPVWFERSFAFRLGPHHLRGRVDRVDRLTDGEAAGEYELIDYKTSRPKTAAQLERDVQLSLYALAAREAWQLESSRQAYYYVLDDRKVPLASGERDGEWVTDVVLEVGEGILAQRFEPTPSRPACSLCDYRIVCPAAER